MEVRVNIEHYTEKLFQLKMRNEVNQKKSLYDS